ncbi:uncharacterized protein LOC117337208 [Pecten maximus]|uniref:uncharacterized protein LOC117337208 n=1 Tax=Pecten maximus TaxID=6579 RepID=UPI00145868E6|nr:uncharacterized protein LOC117337208 [Pecten maximus]
MNLLTAVIAAVVLEVCCAHMCMISPPQRGSMLNLNKAGSSDCVLTTPRCGGRPRGMPVMGLRRGQNFTVSFQKNLDHYVAATPGSFTVSIGSERGGTKLNVLANIPDAGEPSLTVYSVNVTIPMDLEPRREYIMHSAYITNNPQAPPEFFQCADIMVNE